MQQPAAEIGPQPVGQLINIFLCNYIKNGAIAAFD
jgi:hypothetical protein